MSRRLRYLLRGTILRHGVTPSTCGFNCNVIIFTPLKSIPSNDLHGGSVLGIEVYRHRVFTRDEYVGGAKERIEFLVAEGATGGQPSLSTIECTRNDRTQQPLLAN